MIEDIKNISTTKEDIRKFGYLVGGIIVLIGLFILWKGTTDYRIFLGLGLALIILGVVIPSVLKPIYYVWMVFATILGWIMTRVILTVIFYLIVTPIGLIAKIFRKKFLDLSFKTNDTTYWNYRQDSESNIEKQF